jgi:hypothetical protein
MPNTTKNKKIPTRWKLRVRYNKGSVTMETWAIGSSKNKALQNWFERFYCGNIPTNPTIPHDAKSVIWESRQVLV